MEKISGIIPANARTRSVDVTNSQPVRPGPAWGRREGRVTSAAMANAAMEPAATIEDRVTRTTDAVAAKASVNSVYNNNAEMARSKVVEQLASKFFDTTAKADVRGAETTKSEEALGAMNEAQDLAPVTSAPATTIAKA